MKYLKSDEYTLNKYINVKRRICFIINDYKIIFKRKKKREKYILYYSFLVLNYFLLFFSL